MELAISGMKQLSLSGDGGVGNFEQQAEEVDVKLGGGGLCFPPACQS